MAAAAPTGYNVTSDGDFTHEAQTAIDAMALGGDAFTQSAITEFTTAVSQEGVSTGDIIAKAAELKLKLGASKAYFDAISTLSDDQKRLIEGAVR